MFGRVFGCDGYRTVRGKHQRAYDVLTIRAGWKRTHSNIPTTQQISVVVVVIRPYTQKSIWRASLFAWAHR